ncbi:MAG: helix-turn-helix domain-containing protein [Solirubrobacterales bacterium]|nr:helix-turn-helix domain-containing protein [Solirubrobacterales bacterium]
MSTLLQALLVELNGADPDMLAALRERLALRPEKEVTLADNSAEPLLTCSEAAERARVHIETIRRAVRRGELPASRAGRCLRIAVRDLEAWLKAPKAQQQSASLVRRRAPSSRARRPLATALAALDMPWTV